MVSLITRSSAFINIFFIICDGSYFVFDNKNKNNRNSKHKINPLFINRWSPRSMTGDSLKLIQLWTIVDLGKLDSKEVFKSKPMAWTYTERIGRHDVQCIIHPNGLVMGS